MARRKVINRIRNCHSRVSFAREAEMRLNEKQAAQEQRSRARQETQAPIRRDGPATVSRSNIQMPP